MALVARLASLLATIDSATPAFTIFQVADGVRLLGPPVDGVAALLVLSGTMHLDDRKRGDDGKHGVQPVKAGRLVLLPPNRRASITASPAPTTTTIDGRACVVHRDGWVVADGTRGRPPTLTVAAARIAGSSGETLEEPLISAINTSDAGRPLFALLKAEYARGAQGHPALAMSLMSACVVEGLRSAIAAAPAPAPAADAATRGLVGRAIAAIRARPGEPHTVDTLAQTAGMSRSTFIRHFRRLIGMSPIEYVQRVRLDEAKAMLGSTDLPIKAVAASTGFASRSHFSRLFRAAFGRDPTGFREQVEQDGTPAA